MSICHVFVFVLHSCNIKVLEVYAMASQLQLELHFVIISMSKRIRNRIKNPDRNCCYCAGFFIILFC